MRDFFNKTNIIYHRGTHNIGGTFIEIRYNDSRVFFDMGDVTDFYEESIDFKDLYNKGYLAKVEGIYDPILLDTNSRFSHHAGFISHGHLDHTTILNFTDPKIPVYTSKKTKSIIESFNIMGDKLYPFTDSQIKCYNHKSYTRPITGIDEGEIISVGEINVVFFPVDHDCYGACGMIIKTPDLKIAYTGDIRLHGYRKNDTIDFINKARGCDVLISEGVNFSFPEKEEKRPFRSEKDVIEDIKELVIKNSNRNISFSYYELNIERIMAIIDSISPYREVVLSDYSAYILKSVTNKEVKYYKLRDFDFGLDRDLEIDINKLVSDNGKYLWKIDFDNLDFISSVKNGLYIHSDAQPTGEYDPAYKPFMDRFIENGFEIDLFYSSGHATMDDLANIIKEISPKILTPVHSFCPDRVYYNGTKVVPDDGYNLVLE